MRASVLYKLDGDTFNRADNTDLGASWDPGYYTRLDLVSNRVRVSTVTTNSSTETFTAALPANQWARVALPTWAADAVIRYGWLILRGTAPATATWYQFTIARNGGTFTSQISKKIADVETSISSENSTTWAASDVLQASVYDLTLRLYRNNVQLLSGTDASITASLRAGLGAYIDGSAATVEFGDFEVGGFGPLASSFRGVVRGNR